MGNADPQNNRFEPAPNVALSRCGEPVAMMSVRSATARRRLSRVRGAHAEKCADQPGTAKQRPIPYGVGVAFGRALAAGPATLAPFTMPW